MKFIRTTIAAVIVFALLIPIAAQQSPAAEEAKNALAPQPINQQQFERIARAQQQLATAQASLDAAQKEVRLAIKEAALELGLKSSEFNTNEVLPLDREGRSWGFVPIRQPEQNQAKEAQKSRQPK